MCENVTLARVRADMVDHAGPFYQNIAYQGTESK